MFLHRAALSATAGLSCFRVYDNSLIAVNASSLESVIMFTGSHHQQISRALVRYFGWLMS